MSKSTKSNGRGAVLEAPEGVGLQANTTLPADLFAKVAAAAKGAERTVAGQMRLIAKQWAEKQPTP